jgi:hypothetical protein
MASKRSVEDENTNIDEELLSPPLTAIKFEN